MKEGTIIEFTSGDIKGLWKVIWAIGGHGPFGMFMDIYHMEIVSLDGMRRRQGKYCITSFTIKSQSL